MSGRFPVTAYIAANLAAPQRSWFGLPPRCATSYSPTKPAFEPLLQSPLFRAGAQFPPPLATT